MKPQSIGRYFDYELIFNVSIFAFLEGKVLKHCKKDDICNIFTFRTYVFYGIESIERPRIVDDRILIFLLFKDHY